MFFDLSIPLSSETEVYPGDPVFSSVPVCSVTNGDDCTVSRWCMGSHAGTHLDAPRHFFPQGSDITELSLEKLCGRSYVADFTEKKWIEPEDLSFLPLNRISIILLKTKTSKNSGILSLSSAQFLVNRGISLIGIDTITIEPPDHKDFAVHKMFLSHNIPILESIQLSHVPEGEYDFFCLPLPVSGADASPVRPVLKTV